MKPKGITRKLCPSICDENGNISEETLSKAYIFALTGKSSETARIVYDALQATDDDYWRNKFFERSLDALQTYDGNFFREVAETVEAVDRFFASSENQNTDKILFAYKMLAIGCIMECPQQPVSRKDWRRVVRLMPGMEDYSNTTLDEAADTLGLKFSESK